jgi:hypothetical protein
MTEFVTIDGEAIKTGQYVLMRDSRGRELVDPAGLKTSQVFRWLLELDQGKGHRTREYVVFGLNYDVNQWLISLRPGQLRTLLDTGTILLWGRYQISWMPAKAFEITDLGTGQWIKICEVFGFFQSSFVKALKAWGFQVPSRMEEMKGARNDFTRRDIPKMSAYCLEECEFLEQLMGRLADACERAQCAPTRNWWIGAGSVANALMRNNGVRNHVVHDRDLAERDTVENYVLRAYFGGRVELLTQGTVPDCQTRDIRSAYPWAATFLPSLTGAELEHTARYDPEAEHAIWRCKWTDQAHGQIAPFPTRTNGFAIIYPASGEGCYHAVEVRTALSLGYRITVIDGVILRGPDPAATGRPFAFLPQVYKQRAALKKKGDAAEKALKLGMNSVYGKLAQGYGRTNAAGEVFPPPYQSYMWAGEITARTRARVLEAAHASQGVMMISTDGVFMTRPGVKASSKTDLGTWEGGSLENLFCAMAGVYQGFAEDGTEEVCKSRGFFARDVNYDELRRVWGSDGVLGSYSYRSRRFIGARVALARNKPNLWRQWVDETRSISLYPDPWRKAWTEDDALEGVVKKRTVKGALLENGLVKLFPVDRHIESIPYEPKTALYDLTGDIDEIEAMIGDDQPDYDLA